MAVNLITPQEYFYYDFHNKNRQERYKFVGARELICLWKILSKSSPWHIFADKWKTYNMFEKYYSRKAIHMTKESDRDVFYDFIRQYGKSIVKITDLQSGEGVFCCDDLSSAEQVFNKIIPYLKRGKAAIAEQYIHQEDSMASLNPTSVNTIRISTFIDGEKVLKLFSFLRIGRNGSVVDNGGKGGLIVSVNLQTGICETLGITEKMEKFEYHPDTKIKIQGFQIPHWESALKLSEELAKIVPQQRFASWDLALTKNGWVMIEGNSRGGLFGPQLTTQKGLRDVVERTFYKYI